MNVSFCRKCALAVLEEMITWLKKGGEVAVSGPLHFTDLSFSFCYQYHLFSISYFFHLSSAIFCICHNFFYQNQCHFDCYLLHHRYLRTIIWQLRKIFKAFYFGYQHHLFHLSSAVSLHMPPFIIRINVILIIVVYFIIVIFKALLATSVNLKIFFMVLYLLQVCGWERLIRHAMVPDLLTSKACSKSRKWCIGHFLSISLQWNINGLI